MLWVAVVVAALLVAAVVHDLVQRKHAILRNFPIIGHFRYLLEAVGPELRQYIVTSNDEERPFSRDQRRWVYAASKRQNDYFGFGTDNDLDRADNHLLVKHTAFPLETPHAGEAGYDPLHPIPCAKVLGAARGRAKAFRPASIVNVSAMSFGSLSANAVRALNRGVSIAGALHNTGEGGISPYHREGGELIYQVGTGYFGCRDEHGRFSLERFLDTVASAPVRAIEIKLSQGAKPGLGGVLPAVKITHELAEIRGIPLDRDCISPAGHTAFRDEDELLDFVERLAEKTGLPIGIKSAVGALDFWRRLVDLQARGGRGVDFVTVDGGEGGTGAAPLAFTDHVALPFRLAIARVYPLFARAGLQRDVVFIGSGRLGFPERALSAIVLGCDLVNVAREAMLAIGCIQAQRCHTNHCPTGVATQNAWLVRGLDPASKSARLANYVATLRKEILRLSHACGVPHPALLPDDAIEVMEGGDRLVPLSSRFDYDPAWRRLSPADADALAALLTPKS